MSIIPFQKPESQTVGCALAELLRDSETMQPPEFKARIAAMGLSDLEMARAAQAFRLSGQAKQLEADAMELLGKCRRILPRERYPEKRETPNAPHEGGFDQ